MSLSLRLAAFGTNLSRHRFLTSSIVLHILLISLLGGVVLFKSSQTTDFFVGNEVGFLTEPETTVPENEELLEFTEPEVGESIPESSIMQSGAISALAEAPTEWAVSAPVVDFAAGSTFNPSKMSGTMGKGTGSGAGSGSGMGRGLKGMSGRLAGININARKLGVVLDVSGSAHPYLQYPIREIDQNFSNSLIFLYPGCGMKSTMPREEFDIRPIRSFMPTPQSVPKEFHSLEECLYQVKSTKGVQGVMERFLQRSNVFGTAWSCSRKQCMFAVQYTFERVLQSDVDVIYWFADYRDWLDPVAVEEFAKELKRRNVTLYCHNFVGKFIAPQQEAIVRKLAEDTGGQLIMVVPGKDK